MYTGYTAISFSGDTMRLVITLDLTDLTRVFALDADSNNVVDREELLPRMPEMYAYLQSHLEVRLDYQRLGAAAQEGSFTRDQAGNVFINFNFVQTGVKPPAAISLRYDIFSAFGERYKVLGKVTRGDRTLTFVAASGAPAARIVLAAEGPGLWRQMVTFVRLGIEHIFIGIDHIMFLFGLLILGGTVWNLVKIVSSFTIAHSITLVLAALQIITLPTRLVESVIALTIVYIGVENFYLQKTDHRWILTGLFGFVHGFGFANVLREIGLPDRGLLASLFAFNVGVEIGQVVIVLLMLPVLWVVAQSRYRRKIVFAASSVILFFGASWFLERAFTLPVSFLQ